jgi:hypothetical protein
MPLGTCANPGRCSENLAVQLSDRREDRAVIGRERGVTILQPALANGA